MRRAIETPLDHNKFLASRPKKELLGFVIALNRSCTGRRRIVEQVDDPLLCVLQTIKRRVHETTDAHAAPRRRERFGNKSFRELHSWLPSVVVTLGIEDGDVSNEVGGYLGASFGDPQRLDYGTGHETAFILFLYCLFKKRVLSQSRLGDGSLLRVLAEYFECCRIVQTVYNLEPAGSRGVWALDDYHCLSFLFGSAQHCGGDEIEEKFGGEQDDLFLTSYKYAVGENKQPSPILASLQDKPWRKINTQILLYYEKQVLGKFVVARHILFGRIFPATWKRQGSSEEHRSTL